MTRAPRRLSAARLAFQLAILAPLGSAISGGCSSGVKTVTVSVDCPTGGTGALGGSEAVDGGGSSGISAGGLGMAGEAGQAQAGADSGGDGGAPMSSQGGAAAERRQRGEQRQVGRAVARERPVRPGVPAAVARAIREATGESQATAVLVATAPEVPRPPCVGTKSRLRPSSAMTGRIRICLTGAMRVPRCPPRRVARAKVVRPACPSSATSASRTTTNQAAAMVAWIIELAMRARRQPDSFDDAGRVLPACAGR